MPLLRPGDTFPHLTLTVPGGKTIPVPGWFAGDFGVVLFNRGAWCPYCAAQLRAFQRAGDSLFLCSQRLERPKTHFFPSAGSPDTP